ncbi:MAG: hypothetical protein HY366_00120 [Candidatus Aenigmarchaeota archaeon]|nr:hypothetical protein [Candidatus Aenigmarchaeota archaeon]
MPKGVSPLIATVLLVGFVIGLSGLFINFYTSFQQSRQAELQTTGATTVQCTFASLDFAKADVAYNLTTTPDTVNVTIDNTGSVALYDFEVAVWVSGISYNYALTNTSAKTSASPMQPGAREIMVANVSDDLSGTLQSVRVVAKNCPQSAKKKVDI